MKYKLTRRDFLSAAAILAGGLVINNAVKNKENKQTPKDNGPKSKELEIISIEEIQNFNFIRYSSDKNENNKSLQSHLVMYLRAGDDFFRKASINPKKKNDETYTMSIDFDDDLVTQDEVNDFYYSDNVISITNAIDYLYTIDKKQASYTPEEIYNIVKSYQFDEYGIQEKVNGKFM
ncbi:MAG: twin-arginine translocation signal domain-containing protein [Bacilli bacterium]|nr:twin-arginine translocation signal domain-containing protein [Bacilli bacterium]